MPCSILIVISVNIGDVFPDLGMAIACFGVSCCSYINFDFFSIDFGELRLEVFRCCILDLNLTPGGSGGCGGTMGDRHCNWYGSVLRAMGPALRFMSIG